MGERPHHHRGPGRLGVLVDDPDLAARIRELAAVAGVHTGIHVPGAPAAPWPPGGLAVLDPASARRLASTGGLPPAPTTVVLVASDTDPDAQPVAAAVAAARVVRLPSGAAWLVAALAEACEPSTRDAVVIAVKSCGPTLGAADSGLVTAALARIAGAALTRHRSARGATAPAGAPSSAAQRRCLALDADPASPGIDLRLAAEDLPGVRWPDLAGARGRLPVGFLTDHLPHVDGVTVLSGDRTPRPWPGPQARDAVLAAAWRTFDLALADLGHADTDLGETVLERARHLVLVVPPGVPGLAATRRWLTLLARHSRPPAVHALAVRGPAWSLDAARRVLDDTGIPLTSWTPLRMTAAARADAARAIPPRLLSPRAGLARACRDVLAAVVTAPVLAPALVTPPPPPEGITPDPTAERAAARPAPLDPPTITYPEAIGA